MSSVRVDQSRSRAIASPMARRPDEAEHGLPLSPAQVERLYRGTHADLLVWFCERVIDPELANDLFAETWDKALDGLAGLRSVSEHDSRHWLWTIAAHVLADHLRRGDRDRRIRRRLGHRPISASDQDVERILDRAAGRQLRETIERRLGELPEDQREAVRLRVIDELSYEEIAQLTESTTQNVRARVSRALRKLGSELRDDYEQWRDENL